MRTIETIRADHRARKHRECRDPATWPRYALRRIKARASEMGIPFDLTAADLVLPARCPVFKVPFVLGDQFHPNVPSVDRKIPALGYVHGNVAIISRRANLIKQDCTDPAELRAVAAYLEAQAAGFLAAIAPEIACDMQMEKAPDTNRSAGSLMPSPPVADAGGTTGQPLLDLSLHSQDVSAHIGTADAGKLSRNDIHG